MYRKNIALLVKAKLNNKLNHLKVEPLEVLKVELLYTLEDLK